VALSLAAVVSTSAQAQGVRPEVGKPLQQASELLRAGKAKEALAKAREADAVGGKTAAEQLTGRPHEGGGCAARRRHGHGHPGAGVLYGKVGGAEQGQVAEQLASAYAQQRNNAKATEWLNKAIAAGNNSGTRQAAAGLPAVQQWRLRGHRQGRRRAGVRRRASRPPP
jgi:hypothetical protein